MSFIGNLKAIFGDQNQSFLNKASKIVEKVNLLEKEMEVLKDEDFKNKTEEFKKRLSEGSKLEDILPEAFALVREVSKRYKNQRHYDVQIIGGLAIHEGKIAEMRTGEGKTLVATLPVYLNALTGKGVHVVTVNDFLARRDATWMGEIYSKLGLSVGVVNSQNVSYLYDEAVGVASDEQRDEVGSFKVVYDFLKPCTRKQAYDADITYGTNNEFGFDYLRDNLATIKNAIVQREHNFAVVDEIDSILIDEARTPLIISAPAEDSEDLYVKFSKIAKSLNKNEHYEVDEKLKAITLNDAGIAKAEELLGIENIYTEKGIKLVHHLETAVRAEALFTCDKEYVVNNGEVIIIDQSTGRMMPGRRFNQGLHQALEAKEGVQIQKETKTVASITYQNYFKFYKKLSGMTGTAKTSSEEFFSVYGLDVITIPTHRPIKRADLNDQIYQTEIGKFKAIAKRVKEVHSTGQPILIGTISIERNEMLSDFLQKEGVPHTILNAKKHESEGEIIAGAGRLGAVTIATNMAGRGIDIKLGGELATPEDSNKVRELGGLFVLGTERHESRRIDNQLRGRAGRQGDPGTTQFFVSLDDDLMRVFGGDRIKSMMGRFGIPEDQPIENKMITSGLENAQKKIEGFNFDARKKTLEYDNVLNTQRNAVYKRRRQQLFAEDAEIKDYVISIAEDKEKINSVIEQKIKDVGEAAFWSTVRRIILHVNDVLWTEHLEAMDYVRSSVNLRAYGQREPLIEYTKEGLAMYQNMEAMLKEQVLSLIETIRPIEAQAPVKEEAKKYIENSGKDEEARGHTIKNEAMDKIGRNDIVILEKDGKLEEMKYKKAESLLAEGWVLKGKKENS
ncbi:MAG: Protein translocase subunit SecA [Patescibacteria group bacterium]|jgi:preprotein translocase subunit SecA|nr:Protein translocase subunit SecA [Patescibacteria group bacterium]